MAISHTIIVPWNDRLAAVSRLHAWRGRRPGVRRTSLVGIGAMRVGAGGFAEYSAARITCYPRAIR